MAGSVTDVRVVTEIRDEGSIPLWRHPEWRERFDWLEQGMTGEGEGEPFDLGAFGAVPAGKMMERWRQLMRATGMPTAVHARQVHGADVGEWTSPLPAGIFFADCLDAHVTDQTGLLLAVSTADCVPIFIVLEQPRTVALVHAGWRGVASGALEGTVAVLARRGIETGALWLHCGPAICGNCYEVGPEVHQAIEPGLEPPTGPAPIDLRLAIARRAERLGFTAERVTVSAHCTRCGPGGFFSHRGGSSGRQMGVLGRRE